MRAILAGGWHPSPGRGLGVQGSEAGWISLRMACPQQVSTAGGERVATADPEGRRHLNEEKSYASY